MKTESQKPAEKGAFTSSRDTSVVKNRRKSDKPQGVDIREASSETDLVEKGEKVE